MDSDWDLLKQRIPQGTQLAVSVEQHFPFGVFVKIPGVSFRGLVQITDFKDEGRMTPDEYPAVGSTIDCVVLGFRDANQQIWLSTKPSQLAIYRTNTA